VGVYARTHARTRARAHTHTLTRAHTRIQRDVFDRVWKQHCAEREGGGGDTGTGTITGEGSRCTYLRVCVCGWVVNILHIYIIYKCMYIYYTHISIIRVCDTHHHIS